MRLADMAPEEQVVELSRFNAECERGSQSSSSPGDQADRSAVSNPQYFTISESREESFLSLDSPSYATPEKTSKPKEESQQDALAKCLTPLVETIRATQEATMKALQKQEAR